MQRVRLEKSKRGGKRPGAGRPKGALAIANQVAIELGRKTGKLPAAIMLEWVQTGVMDHPITTYEQRTRVHPANKGEKETYRVAKPKRDANGKVLTEPVVIEPALRAQMATQVAPYYNPRLSSTVDPKPDAAGNYRSAIESDADAVIAKLMAPVKLIEGRVVAEEPTMKDVTPTNEGPDRIQ